jgi:hypothetical protein
MSILGGVLIARPGVRIGMGIEAGVEPGLAMAQYAALPLIVAMALVLVIMLFMKETCPAR